MHARPLSTEAVIKETHVSAVAWTDMAGRGIEIDRNDMIYVADSQSNATNNPGYKQGIRIGSVKDPMPAGPSRWPCGAT
jgi:hypothetical protein